MAEADFSPPPAINFGKSASYGFSSGNDRPGHRPGLSSMSFQERLNPQASNKGYNDAIQTQQQPNKQPETDIEFLQAPDFDAKTFIASKLSNASDVEISKFTDQLTKYQEQVIIDKKDMIYGNYKTFLAVGTQITVLSSELQSLRKMINDLHVTTNAMKQDAENAIASSAMDSSPNSSGNLLTNYNNGNEFPQNNALAPFPRGRTGSRSANRNSVLVLESMWAQDLSGLLRTVEGAQKYLPPIPGRHVVEESSGWEQLNAATWKPWQPVKIFLLNDFLLIAVKKKNKNGDSSLAVVQPTQALVADQCWPLADIQIKDLKNVDANNNSGPLNGIVIQKDRSLFVYRHDSAATVSRFLSAYFKSVRDIRKNQNSSDFQSSRRRESVLGQMFNEGNPVNDNKSHKRSVSVDLSERTKVLRDIDTLINDLDVKISHRMFREAVEIIAHHSKELKDVKELSATAIAAAQAASAASAVGSSLGGVSSLRKGAAGVAGAMPPSQYIDIKDLRAQILKIKLDQRSKEVSDILLGMISQDYLGPSQLKTYIVLLIKLNQTEAVKKTFLSSRRQLILKRIKMVEFKGDIPSYIAQIVTIHFRMIRTTAVTYQLCFKTSEASSAMVEWAKNEVEDYIVFFARQLYNIPPESETYRRCIEVTKEQAVQLKQVGLNLDFLLEYIYGGPDGST